MNEKTVERFEITPTAFKAEEFHEAEAARRLAVRFNLAEQSSGEVLLAVLSRLPAKPSTGAGVWRRSGRYDWQASTGKTLALGCGPLRALDAAFAKEEAG